MAQLKEGSVIRKSTGDEVIATEEYVNKNAGGGGTKIVTSATEPSLEAGDQWHKEI